MSTGPSAVRLRCNYGEVTGIFDAIISSLVIKSGAKVKVLIEGNDSELRLAFKEALTLAVLDSDIPSTVSPTWVVDAFMGSGLQKYGAPSSVTGDKNLSLELDSTDFANRLETLLPYALIGDMNLMQIDVTRLLEAFGERFKEAILIHAMQPDSHLAGIASRIEASDLMRTNQVLASSLGVNLRNTRDTLNQLRIDSLSRTYMRLDSLGVPEQKFETLIKSINSVRLPVIPARGFFAIEADGGSGKSTLAERLLAEDIDHALAERSAPLPIFIQASHHEGPIRDLLLRIWGDPHDIQARGINIIFDGLEEIGSVRARRIVLDIKTLMRDGEFNVRRAIVTSRPLNLRSYVDEVIRFEMLSPSESDEIITSLTGSRFNSYSLRPILRDAIRRPFFAIAFGLEIGQSATRKAHTQSTLIRSIVERALVDFEWDDATQLLMRSAAASVDARHGPVPIHNVAQTREQEEILKRSKLVRVDDERLSFQVALIAEWFAAEHLRLNPELIDRLVEDIDRLDLWRYALRSALESQSYEQSRLMLAKLALAAPGMTGWLLSRPDPFKFKAIDSLSNSSLEAIDTKSLAERIQYAFASLGNALQTASTRMQIFSSGQLNNLDLEIHGNSVQYTWLGSPAGTANSPNREGPSIDNQGDSKSSFSRSVEISGHPSWEWIHAHDALRECLQGLIHSGGVFEGASQYESERLWIAVLEALGGKGNQRRSNVELKELVQYLERRLNGGAGDTPSDYYYLTIRELVSRLRKENRQYLEAPWGSPWLQDSYPYHITSSEQFIQRMNAATMSALLLYEHVFEGPLHHFSSELRLARDWPISFVGYVFPETKSDLDPSVFSVDYERGIKWFVVSGSNEIRVDWRVAHMEQSIDHNENLPFLQFRSEGGKALISEAPATAFATELLWRDLAELSWVQGEPPRDYFFQPELPKLSRDSVIHRLLLDSEWRRSWPFAQST